jgi:hypothetical protein
MLNTDQHSPQVRKKMAFEDYKKNLKGVNENSDFSDDFLVSRRVLARCLVPPLTPPFGLCSGVSLRRLKNERLSFPPSTKDSWGSTTLGRNCSRGRLLLVRPSRLVSRLA